MQYKEIDIELLLSIALNAGNAMMEIYAQDFAIEAKSDFTPVTEADKKANDIIIASLTKTYPDIPYISEETMQEPYEVRKNWNRCWLIDPLDGTKEFIKKNGEFTVNIALVEDGVPVIGIVYAPAQNKMYAGIKGEGSFKIIDGQFEPIGAQSHYSGKTKVTVVASRSHMSAATMAYVQQLKDTGKEVEYISSGSSLKFCLVAEGKADIYPRLTPTMEWDTAAAHAVALYAGRKVIALESKQPLTYNKENLLNPYFIVE